MFSIISIILYGFPLFSIFPAPLTTCKQFPFSKKINRLKNLNLSPDILIKIIAAFDDEYMDNLEAMLEREGDFEELKKVRLHKYYLRHIADYSGKHRVVVQRGQKFIGLIITAITTAVIWASSVGSLAIGAMMIAQGQRAQQVATAQIAANNALQAQLRTNALNASRQTVVSKILKPTTFTVKPSSPVLKLKPIAVVKPAPKKPLTLATKATITDAATDAATTATKATITDAADDTSYEAQYKSLEQQNAHMRTLIRSLQDENTAAEVKFKRQVSSFEKRMEAIENAQKTSSITTKRPVVSTTFRTTMLDAASDSSSDEEIAGSVSFQSAMSHSSDDENNNAHFEGQGGSSQGPNLQPSTSQGKGLLKKRTHPKIEAGADWDSPGEKKTRFDDGENGDSGISQSIKTDTETSDDQPMERMVGEDGQPLLTPDEIKKEPITPDSSKDPSPLSSDTEDWLERSRRVFTKIQRGDDSESSAPSSSAEGNLIDLHRNQEGDHPGSIPTSSSDEVFVPQVQPRERMPDPVRPRPTSIINENHNFLPTIGDHSDLPVGLTEFERGSLFRMTQGLQGSQQLARDYQEALGQRNSLEQRSFFRHFRLPISFRLHNENGISVLNRPRRFMRRFAENNPLAAKFLGAALIGSSSAFIVALSVLITKHFTLRSNPLEDIERIASNTLHHFDEEMLARVQQDDEMRALLRTAFFRSFILSMFKISYKYMEAGEVAKFMNETSMDFIPKQEYFNKLLNLNRTALKEYVLGGDTIQELFPNETVWTKARSYGERDLEAHEISANPNPNLSGIQLDANIPTIEEVESRNQRQISIALHRWQKVAESHVNRSKRSLFVPDNSFEPFEFGVFEDNVDRLRVNGRQVFLPLLAIIPPELAVGKDL